jgi:SagB-type dehydrogenase family enzyme
LPAAEVVINVSDASHVVFERPGQRAVLRGLGECSAAAFGQLACGGAGVASLLAAVRTSNVPGESAALLARLRTLVNGGWLLISADGAEGPLATLEPLSRAFRFEALPLPAHYCLSRFAHLRRSYGDLVLETPLAATRVRLHSPAALELLFRLRQPAEPGEARAAEGDAAEGLLALLHAAGMLTETNPEGMAAEDTGSGLQYWEFHDLLFHSRSREGRHDLPIGATFDWAGESDPPPAVVTDPALPAVPLEAPGNFPSQDPASLVNIVERRRSERVYGAAPLGVRDLGHFLYRVARVKERYTTELETWNGPITMEFAGRPYPSAGALYEMEFYPLVVRCDGVAAGLYRYDPERHALVPIEADPELTAQLAANAAYAAVMTPGDVQVLMILAARFPRVMWKYRCMAYAAILKHVGVLYESMYLTATDLQLAPCAVGIGNADLFSRALKSDYYAETSVGEFLIGSLPDAETAVSAAQRH